MHKCMCKCMHVLTYLINIMKGIQQRRTYYGSSDYTIITIAADEHTPLLVDRVIIWPNNINNIRNYTGNGNDDKKSTLKYGLTSWSFKTCSHSNCRDYTALNRKSFKSHFTELKVFAFSLILAVGVTVAIYLLLIESRLPAITQSLDLVCHDIWSGKTIPKHNHLQHSNVDHIVLLQTGSEDCHIIGNCLEILKEMQNNETEELPYNFLIGGDGHAYEARGWKYQSGMKGTPQEQSLVIGIIGNFDLKSPQQIIFRTIQSLIRESSKRRMINTIYFIYGLRRSDHDRKEGIQLFIEIMKWPEFKGFITKY